MKNGTVYEMLRVHYGVSRSSEVSESDGTTGTIGTTGGAGTSESSMTVLSDEGLVVSVWSFLPAANKPVYTIDTIPQTVEDEMFYVQYENVYVSFQTEELASEDLMSVMKEIAAAEGTGEEVSSGADYPASIMVNGKLYKMAYITINEEIEEDRIIGYTETYTDGIPLQDGETNFNREPGMPYAEVEDGIAVFYENAWQLFTPAK